MNIPTINSITFKDRGREVGKAVEDVAKKSRERATNLIRTEMMNTGECSELWGRYKNWTPLLDPLSGPHNGPHI